MPEDWQKLSTPEGLEPEQIDDGLESGPSPEVLTAIGARRADESARLRVNRLGITLAAILVVGVWFLLELWGLGGTPFHTKGEPREALVVWEMTHDSSWVLPLRNGTELPSKPPLFHWLAAIASDLRGVLDEGTIRLPSALSSLAVALLVVAIGGITWSARAGLLGALVLLTSFEWARAAVNARVDMVLTLGLSIAFFSMMAFLRSRRATLLIPLYLGIAISVLGKGPIGIVLPGLLMLTVCVLSRDVTPIQQMRLVRGAIAVTILGGSWYFLAYREGGYDFFYKQVLDENFFRFFGSDQLSGGHRHSALYLYGMLLAGLLPWTIVLPAFCRSAWRERHSLRAQLGVGYLLLWGAVVTGFYSIPASKRGEYLLALYPAAALLIGWWFDERIREREPDTWLARTLMLVAPIVIVLGVVLAVLAGTIAIGLPADEFVGSFLKDADAEIFTAICASMSQLSGLAVATTLSIFLGSILLYAFARSPRFEVLFLGLFLISAGGTILTQQAIMPGVAQVKTQRELMHDVRALIEPGHTVFFHEVFDYGAVYYWDGHIPTFEGTWPIDAPRYVLTKRSSWQDNRAAAIHYYDVVRRADGSPVQSSNLILVERQGPVAPQP